MLRFLPASFRLHHWLVLGFFAATVALGVGLHRDYGVSWDEPTDRLNGMVNAKYIAERLAPGFARRQESYHLIPELRTFPERDHGVTFELPAAVLTKLLGVEAQQAVYWLRHLLTFLSYVGGMGAFYGLARLRFRDWRLALLGSAALLLTPRLFAEAFYNAKDAVFLALFTLAMFTLARLLRRPTAINGLWHGLATGAAIALRVNGVLLVPLTIAGISLAWWFAPAARGRRWPAAALLWLLAACGATVLLWPYLWEDPLGHFVTAFRNLSRFQRWDGTVLYLGEWARAFYLPWHYAPVWIAITTPLAYLTTFFLGAGVWLPRYLPLVPRLLRTYGGQLDLLTWAWLLGPLVAVVAFRSVLYDGWRHLYFVYPALLLIALHGIQALRVWQRQWRIPAWRRASSAILVILLVASMEPLWRIWRDHPHQQVYFSLVSASRAEREFERDYWGLSYRQGLEWVLREDAAARIPVSADRPELIYNNSLILSPEQRQRIVIVPAEQARYFLTNYRWHPQPWPASYGREVYSLRADGVKILSVLRRPEPTRPKP